MKMADQMAVMLTYRVKTLPPWKPVKGESPFGVGKSYRAARRQYRRAYREWVRKDEYVTQRMYVPMANVEVTMSTPAEPTDDFRIKTPKTVQADFTFTPASTGPFYGN